LLAGFRRGRRSGSKEAANDVGPRGVIASGPVFQDVIEVVDGQVVTGVWELTAIVRCGKPVSFLVGAAVLYSIPSSAA
jgi:hypothetical protein